MLGIGWKRHQILVYLILTQSMVGFAFRIDARNHSCKSRGVKFLTFHLLNFSTLLQAACWAACCSYVAHNSPPALRSSSQGVLQGLHHGLGRGCGAVIGGLFVTYFGSKTTFRGYGIVSIFVTVAFVFINFYRKETGFISNIPTTEDPHQVRKFK